MREDTADKNEWCLDTKPEWESGQSGMEGCSGSAESPRCLEPESPRFLVPSLSDLWQDSQSHWDSS